MMQFLTVINSPGCSTPCMCLHAPATIPCLSDSTGFYLKPRSAGFVSSQRALVPAYLEWMVLPWSGSAACHDHCKYRNTVPGGSTICTCFFVSEYDSQSPPFPYLSLFPFPIPFPVTLRSSFLLGVGGVKQVCLSSVYSMCPLCPHAPCVPWTVPAECALCRRWEY